jgi:hypothetical protein
MNALSQKMRALRVAFNTLERCWQAMGSDHHHANSSISIPTADTATTCTHLEGGFADKHVGKSNPSGATEVVSGGLLHFADARDAGTLPRGSRALRARSRNARVDARHTMSGIQPVGTICFRLLVEPDVGDGIGNTVYVGLEVDEKTERRRLLFRGLPARIASIRIGLDSVRVVDGQLFDSSGPTTAEELFAAMRSRRMQLFAPTLVRGEHLF